MFETARLSSALGLTEHHAESDREESRRHKREVELQKARLAAFMRATRHALTEAVSPRDRDAWPLLQFGQVARMRFEHSDSCKAHRASADDGFMCSCSAEIIVLGPSRNPPPVPAWLDPSVNRFLHADVIAPKRAPALQRKAPRVSADAAECECSACVARRKPPREPGTPFGTNARGEWRQESTYFPQFAEERWERRLERIRKERNLPMREPGEDDE